MRREDELERERERTLESQKATSICCARVFSHMEENKMFCSHSSIRCDMCIEYNCHPTQLHSIEPAEASNVRHTSMQHTNDGKHKHARDSGVSACSSFCRSFFSTIIEFLVSNGRTAIQKLYKLPNSYSVIQSYLCAARRNTLNLVLCELKENNKIRCNSLMAVNLIESKIKSRSTVAIIVACRRHLNHSDKTDPIVN